MQPNVASDCEPSVFNTLPSARPAPPALLVVHADEGRALQDAACVRRGGVSSTASVLDESRLDWVAAARADGRRRAGSDPDVSMHKSG